MDHKTEQLVARRVWALARRQHWVVARRQLLKLGVHSHAITHRLAVGRLHRVYRGVYAVGRPELTREGRWMAAVLRCGPDALLSHRSAAELWEILPEAAGGGRFAGIEVSVPSAAPLRPPGITVYRRPRLAEEQSVRPRGIPATGIVRTLLDLATCLGPPLLEAAVNKADKRDLIDPESLRSALDRHAGERGVRSLRDLLDRHTFRLTDSDLERRFLRIVERAGLPLPDTQVKLGSGRIDFHWPELGLVVETDGLRYHRTPAQQARDTARDRGHVAAGRTPVRFTHGEVRYRPAMVASSLTRISRRLAAGERAA